jgi:hypothetical protein
MTTRWSFNNMQSETRAIAVSGGRSVKFFAEFNGMNIETIEHALMGPKTIAIELAQCASNIGNRIREAQARMRVAAVVVSSDLITMAGQARSRRRTQPSGPGPSQFLSLPAPPVTPAILDAPTVNGGASASSGGASSSSGSASVVLAIAPADAAAIEDGSVVEGSDAEEAADVPYDDI